MVNTSEMSVIITFIGCQVALVSLQNWHYGGAVQISSSQGSVDPVVGRVKGSIESPISDVSSCVTNEAIGYNLVKVKIQTHIGDFAQGAVVKKSGILGLGLHLLIQLYCNDMVVGNF